MLVANKNGNPLGDKMRADFIRRNRRDDVLGGLAEEHRFSNALSFLGEGGYRLAKELIKGLDISITMTFNEWAEKNPPIRRPTNT